MRKARLLLIPILLAGLIVACATTSTTVTPAQQYDLNAYKILAGAKASYDTAFSALAAVQKAGKLSDADAQKAINAGNIFYVVYLAAESSYEAYHAAPTDATQQSLANQLADLSKKLGDLLAAIPMTGGTK